MNTDLKLKFISQIDTGLRKLDFNFVKSRQLWKRSSNIDEEWIHINFGLSVINVTFGIKYKELKKFIKPSQGNINMVSESLNDFSNEFFSDDSNPVNLMKTILEVIPVKLEDLKNRENVIKRLLSESAANWPVPSLSHRIRLLPILLLNYDSTLRAIECAEKFDILYSDKDQLLPNYSEFKDSIVKFSKTI